MDRSEVARHWGKKFVQASEKVNAPKAFLPETLSRFPVLPCTKEAPDLLSASLKERAEAILGGRWKLFGHLPLQVDDPPAWHRDYLIGINLKTNESGFKLNHRELPAAADIKLVWELSRWQELARLAQAGWLFQENRFSEKCVQWLESWTKTNPPYKGWNWTSALESGLRLIQFAWMDALLSHGAAFPGRESRLDALRKELLAPHARFTWRYRSFGSSANNHLLGELSGLIVASVRWPSLARACADLARLKSLWETEVLAQFAEDGGNQEQALNYHLFSLELCLHARLALASAKMEIDPQADERLRAAARFYVNVQADHEPWDYGDSDNAQVVDLVTQEEKHSLEWKDWMEGKKNSSIAFWIGRESLSFRPSSGWEHFVASGYVTFRSGDWFLRWDVSPLGYLKTAAHGHLDALHLSLWYRGLAIVVDPGTGAYYGDAALRTYLASRRAHNGPAPIMDDLPRRRGPFLWSSAHPKPIVAREGAGFQAELLTSSKGKLRRTITPCTGKAGWDVQDAFATGEPDNGFNVLWQFAPGIRLEQTGEREFNLKHADTKIVLLQVGENWSGVELGLSGKDSGPGEGTVSPSFRQTSFGQFLKLTAPPHRSGLFQSRFLVCGQE